MPRRLEIQQIQEKPPYKKKQYEEFIKYKGLPDVIKDEVYGFHTDVAFARKWHLAPDSLVDWQKRVDFLKRVMAVWKDWGMLKTPNVIMGVYRNAVKKGSGADALAWMKIVHDWKEKMDPAENATRKSIKDIQDNLRKIVESEIKKNKKVKK